MVDHLRPYVRVDKLNAPHICKNCRRDPEARHVCQGVEFAAEFARRIGHASDPSVQAVQRDREPDGYRCNFKALSGGRGIDGKDQRALNGSDDRNESEKNVSGRKKCWQRKSRPRRLLARDDLLLAGDEIVRRISG
jgi:hypothetical protein